MPARATVPVEALPQHPPLSRPWAAPTRAVCRGSQVADSLLLVAKVYHPVRTSSMDLLRTGSGVHSGTPFRTQGRTDR